MRRHVEAAERRERQERQRMSKEQYEPINTISWARQSGREQKREKAGRKRKDEGEGEESIRREERGEGKMRGWQE
eukprot:9494799-Pyramimonas_sp.AAC.1